MASWMVHLRIADQLFDKIEGLAAKEFFVGNIAPDCGVPNEDWSVYTPSKTVSHFEREEADVKYIMLDEYNSKHLNEKSYNKEAMSFYLGYYSHLITDILWKDEIYSPTKKKFLNEYISDENKFNWNVKGDWYDLDHLYLKKHPNFRAYREYEAAREFANVYMKEFSLDAFAKRLDYITAFYNDTHENLDRPYNYLTEEEMEKFVDNSVSRIYKELIDYVII